MRKTIKQIGRVIAVLGCMTGAGCLAEPGTDADVLDRAPTDERAAEPDSEAPDPATGEDALLEESEDELAFARDLVASDEQTSADEPMLVVEGTPVRNDTLALPGSADKARAAVAEPFAYGFIEGRHEIRGGPVGVSYDFLFGSSVCPWGRTREYPEAWAYNVQPRNAANCSVVRWYNDGNPYDCRVVIHVGASWWSSATCVMRVAVQ